MAHRQLRGFGNVAIETTQECLPCGRDPVNASTSVVCICLSHDESVALQPRDETGEIGIARYHPLSNLVAGQSTPPGGPENSRDVVLGRGESGRARNPMGRL